MDGFLLIDKPEGWTSHDVVAALRGALGMRRIGHAGTLDPFATGLLVVGIGAATGRLADVQAFEKEYLAEMRLGATSTTDDRTGEISEHPGVSVSRTDIEAVLPRFLGEIRQVPPMYSAKKVAGRKLYELARAGRTVERKAARVTVHALSFTEGQPKEFPMRFRLRVVCSRGTYVRALARDIGEALGVGGYLEELRRTRIGPYRVEDARGPKGLPKDAWEGRLLPAGQ